LHRSKIDLITPDPTRGHEFLFKRAFSVNGHFAPAECIGQFNQLLSIDLGDLFISVEIVDEHAKEYEHSFDRELGYTIVHGILHLNGYDHIKKEDEKVMIGLQEKILSAYGLEK